MFDSTVRLSPAPSSSGPKGKTPTTLILRERKTPRETFVQIRGDFLRPGDKVVPSYPAALTGKNPPASKNQLTRLDLIGQGDLALLE